MPARCNIAARAPRHIFVAALLVPMLCFAVAPAPQTRAQVDPQSPPRAADAQPTPTPTPPPPPPRAADAQPPPSADQPPIRIDRDTREVTVAAEIVLRDAGLEFVACYPGKEHESVARLAGTAAQLRAALIAIGLQPGAPPMIDPRTERRIPPRGPLVDVFVETKEPDGAWQRRPAMSWVRIIETQQPAIPRPWVFTGSIPLENERLAADQTGSALAVVDKSDALFCLTQFHISRLALLWAEANTPAIPPRGTHVRVVFKPAAPMRHAFTLDQFGRPHINDQLVSVATFLDLLQLSARTNNHAPKITLRNTFYAERLYWEELLRGEGIAARLEPGAAGAPHPPRTQTAPATQPRPTP